jgi:methylmalonyl-CoA/ethylmalonyl-CoA epimerase
VVDVPPAWRLHHVGVAVPDVRAAAEPYVAAMGMVPLGDVVRDEVQRVDLLFLGAPGSDPGIALELVAPYDDASPVAGHLLRGIGAYHTCYEVGDLDGALRRLRGARFRVLAEPVPAVAFDGRPIAWVLAPSRHLVELLGSG